MANIIKMMMTDDAKDIVDLNSMTLKEQKEYMNYLNSCKLWMVSEAINHLPDKYYYMGIADAYADKNIDNVFEAAVMEVIKELNTKTDSSDNADQ